LVLTFDVLRFRSVMSDHGDSIQSLADALGVSRQNVSQVLNGKGERCFTLPQLVEIAKRYELSAQDFFEIFISFSWE
jgi:antitoxin component HigA of HigAB toxin-antitoxin module